MVNWNTIGQLFSLALVSLSGPIIILFLYLNRGKL